MTTKPAAAQGTFGCLTVQVEQSTLFVPSLDILRVVEIDVVEPHPMLSEYIAGFSTLEGAPIAVLTPKRRSQNMAMGARRQIGIVLESRGIPLHIALGVDTVGDVESIVIAKPVVPFNSGFFPWVIQATASDGRSVGLVNIRGISLGGAA